MHRLGKYLLGDFGIAKIVDNSHTLVGTNSYIAPEVWQGGDQTIKLDIYGLGVTVIEALDGFPDLAKRPATWQQWHHFLQIRANEHPITSMLASSPDERPTAHQIVRTFFPDSLPREWVRMGSTGLSPKIPRLTPRRDVVPRRHKQSDIARTKPAKSANQKRKKSRARSQSAGVPNPRSKSVRAKVHEMRGAGKDLRKGRGDGDYWNSRLYVV
jgi:serine/threonine protein kinase